MNRSERAWLDSVSVPASSTENARALAGRSAKGRMAWISAFTPASCREETRAVNALPTARRTSPGRARAAIRASRPRPCPAARCRERATALPWSPEIDGAVVRDPEEVVLLARGAGKTRPAGPFPCSCCGSAWMNTTRCCPPAIRSPHRGPTVTKSYQIITPGKVPALPETARSA